MNIDLNEIEFSPIFRKDISDKVRNLFKEELNKFNKLYSIFSDLDRFLVSKCNRKDNYSKEYFTRIFNIRIKDHFSSAIILVSQGFNVDAISLTRSALEDLFVILNFYLDKNYFDKWKINKNNFTIKPKELRNNKNIKTEDKTLYKNVYKALSNIVHPKKESILHMLKFHPTVVNEGVVGINAIKKDINLINIAFYVYIYQVSSMLKSIYKSNKDSITLKCIIDKLLKVDIIEDFMNPNLG